LTTRTLNMAADPDAQANPAAPRKSGKLSATNSKSQEAGIASSENLSEIDSLPHLRNLSEMTLPERRRAQDGATMKERKAVTAVMLARYRRASKKQKGRLLDELVALTGYNRVVCGRAATWPRPAAGWVARAGAGAAAGTGAGLRCGGAGRLAAGLGGHGLHLRQAPGGGVARDRRGARAARAFRARPSASASTAAPCSRSGECAPRTHRARRQGPAAWPDRLRAASAIR